jgi:hypothetical protein
VVAADRRQVTSQKLTYVGCGGGLRGPRTVCSEFGHELIKARTGEGRGRAPVRAAGVPRRQACDLVAPPSSRLTNAGKPFSAWMPRSSPRTLKGSRQKRRKVSTT